MIDIHCHILYGIDDGSRSKEESIKLLKLLENYGFTEIVLTPHFIEDSKYMTSTSKIQELIDELQKETRIKLYIGNEVYFSEKTIGSLKNKKLSTLNNSRYILIEFPLNNEIKNVDEMVYDLTTNGVIPIIAHPERYTYVQQDYRYLDRFKDVEVLFQSNYGSLTGKYGTKAQKTVKKLLKNNYISFFGTDIHHIDKPVDVEHAMKKLKRIVKDDEIVKKLTHDNIKKVINNEKL